MNTHALTLTLVAVSVLVVISGFASSAFAAHDIHSKEARDGKKAFGGYADYSRAVKNMGEARVDHAVREALGRDHGDGRYNAAEHDLSGARDSIHNALETGDIAKIKTALGELAAAGGAHDAQTIARVAEIQKQVQMAEYNARMAALRAAHSAAVSGTYTPATQAQIDRAAQMTQAKLESGTSVADMMGHIAEQMASGKVDPALTSAERAVVHSFATSRNTAPADLTPEQAHAAMNGISVAYGKLQAGQITVGEFQQHIDEQKASGAVHSYITNLEQKMLNSFVASRFNVVTQQTPTPMEQQIPQAVPHVAPSLVPTAVPHPVLSYAVPELPKVTPPVGEMAVPDAVPPLHLQAKPGEIIYGQGKAPAMQPQLAPPHIVTGIGHYEVPNAPADPIQAQPMSDTVKARLAQMISDMKAQGVTQEQARQSVDAFVANGKNEEAMMVSDAFGLTVHVVGGSTTTFGGNSQGATLQTQEAPSFTGESPKSLVVSYHPALPPFSGAATGAVPQVTVTGESPLHVPVATASTQEPVAVPVASRTYQEPMAVPQGMTGQIVPTPVPQGVTDQRIPQVKLVQATPIPVPHPVPVLAPKPRQAVPNPVPYIRPAYTSPNPTPVLAPKPRQAVPNPVPYIRPAYTSPDPTPVLAPKPRQAEPNAIPVIIPVPTPVLAPKPHQAEPHAIPSIPAV